MLLHILTFNNSNLLPWGGMNASVKFSVVFKYYECMVFIASYIFYKYNVSIRKFTWFFVVFTGAVIFSIFFTDIFPDFIDQELKPTFFKVFVDYVGVALTLLNIVLFITKRNCYLNGFTVIMIYLSLDILSKVLMNCYVTLLTFTALSGIY